jgi:hypothetical protein
MRVGPANDRLAVKAIRRVRAFDNLCHKNKQANKQTNKQTNW